MSVRKARFLLFVLGALFMARPILMYFVANQQPGEDLHWASIILRPLAGSYFLYLACLGKTESVAQLFSTFWVDLDTAKPVEEMDQDEFLEQAYELTRSKLEDLGDDISKLSAPFRVLVLVYSAQCHVDNGGLVSFFESDWEGNPPYELFSAAYREIGHEDGATSLEQAVATFPFEQPHLQDEKRRQFLEQHYDHDEIGIRGWDDLLCGDARVWPLLADYVRKHAAAFGLS